ncbi:MAG: tetratricopeptide repeat protein [Pseudomonadota bacterium]
MFEEVLSGVQIPACFCNDAEIAEVGCHAKTRGDLDAAEDFLKQSLDINKALGRKEGMAITLGNLGNITRQRGDLAAARRYYEQCRDLFGEMGASSGEGGQIVARLLAELDAEASSAP